MRTIGYTPLRLRSSLPIFQIEDWSKLLTNEEYFSGWRLPFPTDAADAGWDLIAEDDIEQEARHRQAAVVLDKSQLAELVHRKPHAGPCRTDYLGQRFLTIIGQGRLRLVLFPDAAQQQHPREPHLAGIEKLIRQIRVDSEISRQHIGQWQR